MRAVVILDQPANYLPKDLPLLVGYEALTCRTYGLCVYVVKGLDDSDTAGNHAEISYFGAGDESRTHDIYLGKVALYH